MEFGLQFSSYGGSSEGELGHTGRDWEAFFLHFPCFSFLCGAVYTWGFVFCYSLGDALDNSNSMQTIQKTTTLRLVDGKVVSETSEAKVLRH